MNFMAMLPGDDPRGFKEMQQPHPIATACGFILALAFGLFCLCASAFTSVRKGAAHSRVVNAQVKAHGENSKPKQVDLLIRPGNRQHQRCMRVAGRTGFISLC
jgi:hypothetical protein